MTRRMLVAGNWKMNLSKSESIELARGVAEAATGGAVDVAIFPTYPWLDPVRESVDVSDVVVGAQDCYFETSGAFTGEVSPAALAEICGAVLAGHSERRHVIGESDDLVRRKVNAILDAGMVAYLCVGETLEERNSGRAEEVVRRHLESGLSDVGVDRLDRIVVAYEPVWAIGTGVAASADDAQEMCRSVRDWLEGRFDEPGRGVRVLYGGSVNPENADELFGRPDIDGGLVGGASLNAETFGALIAAAKGVTAV